ncbi:NUDIX domain-containing protein [Candidatus Nanosalina sp. VS9-1]|uniref:NUDIX domain-containing protein n=1 Tax=Candidatus Nanosalina sp. VS9-1 TaxID=3388566 RepID=UPI0039E108FB
MGLTSWILWHGEKIGSSILSRFFWPPASASAVILDGEEILVVDKSDYLMLPGGLLERGENFEQAVEREVREETGLEVEVLEEIDEFVKDFAGVEKIFTATVKDGELESSWEGTPKYISLGEASDRRWRWNRDIKDLIEKAQR